MLIKAICSPYRLKDLWLLGKAWFSDTLVYERTIIQGTNNKKKVSIMAQRPMGKIWGHSKKNKKKKTPINTTDWWREECELSVFRTLWWDGMALVCNGNIQHYQDAKEENWNCKVCFKTSSRWRLTFGHPFQCQWK